MNWHSRYVQQASWSRALRAHSLARARLPEAHRVLEVGCGTGAVLMDVPGRGRQVFGLDLDGAALTQCREHVPAARLVRGDALALPFKERSLDVVWCHYLLLWVADPIGALREMKRVTASGGWVLALSEPDYLSREDAPVGLVELGRLQTAALKAQGADPGFGRRLSAAFLAAGLKLVEAGTLERMDASAQREQRDAEWEIIEWDLRPLVSPAELEDWRRLDLEAWTRGERHMHVPTYFALGRA